MELRHLRYFVAVAEELSFTKAAQKLRLAQPSLTRQVRNLEDEIGVRLFTRVSNRITLTDEGDLFLFDSKRLLALAAENVVAVQQMSRGESSRLNIGYVADIHYGLLPATLGTFRKLCPSVALNLFDLTKGEQFAALEAHRIDLGFIGVLPSISHRDLRSECFAHDTILVALPVNHPLAKKKKIQLSDLATQFFICMSAKSDPGDSEWVSTICRRAGFSPKILQEALDGPSAIKFVKDGLGVSLLPEQITGILHEGVVFRPFSPPLRRESSIAWRGENPSEALKNFIQIVNDLSPVSPTSRD